MKSVFTVLLATLIILFGIDNIHAQVFLSQDFESVSNPGLPSQWTSVPESQWATGDPNSVTPAVSNKLHLSLNTPEHTKAVGVDGSLMTSEGAMLVSPLISIPFKSKHPILTYDVAFFGLQLSEPPYEGESVILIVSKDGGLTWSDVAFIAPLINPQISVWDSRSFNMEEYVGQNNLKIGIRYNNQGGSLLGAAFDNFRIVNGSDAAVISLRAGDKFYPQTKAGYQIAGSGTSLTGTIKNLGAGPISNFYIKYSLGNGLVQSSQLISALLEPMDTLPFPSGLNIMIPSDSDYILKAWIELAGDVDPLNDTMSTRIVGVPYYPLKTPVFEEGTGTWCGWCPRGAVYMDEFSVSHPNSAAQISIHNGDPMTVTEYNNFMSNYSSAFPNLVIDRNAVNDPDNIDSAFILAQNNFGFADITLGSPLFSDNTVSIPVTILPVVDIPNPRLSLVITESNIKGSVGNWSQNNYYSGGANGIMGGWEKENSSVSDVYYHFVGRSITPGPEGSVLHLPTVLLAGTTYNGHLIATIDEGQWKKEDLQYIALLIDGNNNSILNSAFTPLPELMPTLGNTNSSPSILESVDNFYLFPNPANEITTLEVPAINKARKIYIVNCLGVLLKSVDLAANENFISLNVSDLSSGLYYIKIEGLDLSKKLIKVN